MLQVACWIFGVTVTNLDEVLNNIIGEENEYVTEVSSNDDTTLSSASPLPDIWSWGLHPKGLGYVPHVRKRPRLYLSRLPNVKKLAEK